MTYCLAACLDQGLVFGSDSRTNAGVDYVTTYSKMHVFQPAPDRLFVILSAGSLATTQEIVYHIQRDLDHAANTASLSNVRYLFEAAEYLGQVSQNVQLSHGPALQASGFSGEASLILGGQIQGHDPQIILIYPQGNYITASDETPYLQIGESKYGKPVLDRFLRREISLEVGARIALTSLDGTARSNVTVGPPFEIALYRRDTLTINQHMQFSRDDPYLVSLRDSWNQGMERALYDLPLFEWESGAADAQN
jgi:putative proteasome-type protease